MNKLLQHLLICCLLPTAYSLLLYSYPPGWSDDILLSHVDPKHRLGPDVDVDDYNNVWAVWDTATWVNGTAEILYSKRDSLGNCLIPETAVSNNPSYSIKPRVAVDASNNVHFVWYDQTPQGMGLWHAKLGNDGTVLMPSHLAVNGAGGLGMSMEIALNKYQDINVAWAERPSGYNQMSYTQLDSLGNPIIENIRVTPVGLNAYWVGIGVDSFANNHLACRTDSGGITDRLTYSKLDKDGDILISNEILGFGAQPIMVADQSQNIHMVYSDPTGPGIRIEYLKLDQNGNILIGPQVISTPEILNNSYADMAIDSLQYLHVVWQGDSSAVVHIMYCKMDTLGNYIIAPMKIVYPYQGIEPRIAVDRSNRLHVVWIDGRMNPGVSTDIFYKRGENEPGIEETTQLETTPLPKITVSPNPFNNSVTIRFFLGQSTSARTKNMELKIYDVSGKLVKEFNLKSSVVWSGCDNSGKQLPNGVYFLKFRIGDYSATEKLLLIR